MRDIFAANPQLDKNATTIAHSNRVRCSLKMQFNTAFKSRSTIHNKMLSYRRETALQVVL